MKAATFPRDVLERLVACARYSMRPGDELILHPQGEEFAATLRRCDGPPEVYVWRDGAGVALDPAADPDLHGAPIVGDPEMLEAILAPLIGGIEEIHVVAWRVRRRIVARLRSGGGTVHWLKLLDPKNFGRASLAFRSVRSFSAPVRLILPEHELPEICGFLLPHAPGTPLHDSIHRGEIPQMRMLASILRALGSTETAPGLPTCTFDGVRAATTRMLERASTLDPLLLDLAARVYELPTPPDSGSPVFVHGDLHDKQLLFRPAEASLIDLEGMAVGDARFDVVNLAEHLRLREIQRTGTVSGLDEQALSACGLDPDESGTLAFRAVVRARLCAVYALRPRWHSLTARLHVEALALLRKLR